MTRLIAELNLQERPTFSEYLLSRTLLPPQFRADVPLLRIVFPEHSFFDTAQSTIRPESLGALVLMAAMLRREIPDVAVFVVGHTDNRGGEDYNRSLSIARANAVASELGRIGVGEVALWRIGFGEAVPLLPNDSPANMAINRRVEFIIGARTEAVATWLARQCPDLVDSRVARCRTAERAPPFVAINVTSRSGLSVQPPASPRRRLPPVGRRGQSLPAPGGLQERIGEVGARPRIVIDLHVRQYRIPALNPL
jgi:outer membrane protein OmpA-like peptidoglycan-associated protein